MSQDKKIGIFGGHSVYEFGTEKETLQFFELARRQLEMKPADIQLLEKLYSGYVPHSENAQIFKWVDSLNQGLLKMADTEMTDTKTARDVRLIQKFNDALVKAAESARAFYEEFKIDHPVRIVRSDLPEFMIDKTRLLSEYEANRGLPFWRSPSPERR